MHAIRASNLISVTCVVDTQRKISPKPPVLSPKPNPSEIVKRLSFKRDAAEAPPPRQPAVTGGTDPAHAEDSKEEAGTKAVTNGESSTATATSSTESRVSSMIARLSNGSSASSSSSERKTSSDLQSSIKVDRQNFMSKFIKTEAVASKQDEAGGPGHRAGSNYNNSNIKQHHNTTDINSAAKSHVGKSEEANISEGDAAVTSHNGCQDFHPSSSVICNENSSQHSRSVVTVASWNNAAALMTFLSCFQFQLLFTNQVE